MSFYNKVYGNYGFSQERLRSQENLFHAIYFLDYESGSLLVSNRFSNNLSFLKDDLICSFLNAINLFINELKEGVSEEIQEINFSDTRIQYEREGRLVVIAITKKNDFIEDSNLIQIKRDLDKSKNYKLLVLLEKSKDYKSRLKPLKTIIKSQQLF